MTRRMAVRCLGCDAYCYEEVGQWLRFRALCPDCVKATSFSQVDVLKAYYIVEDAEVGEWRMELHPDLYLHEYPNGEYLVLHAQKDKGARNLMADKVVEDKGALDSAVDIFVRLQAGLEGFRLEDCATDIWKDLRSAQVRIAVANV